MIIKGKYRDILMRNGVIIKDCGWRCNTIVPDYGRFLAALMKKDFQAPPVGIEYLAVGSGSPDETGFKDKLIGFFEWLNEDETHTGPFKQNSDWVWAKGIEVADIAYLDSAGIMSRQVTNRLEIEVKIAPSEPAAETLGFREFALLGIDRGKDGKFDTAKLFLVNYVTHGLITKDKDMELSRTIKLIFPITQEIQREG